MSFLYPLFLLAGLSLIIPVLIHLFNLRKYKVFYFPHTRFLKDIQLSSRKQSQVRYKWLLAMRLLFLIFIVLAFAQPFFNKKGTEDQAGRLQIIYLDNSFSMSVKSGVRSLLDIVKESAIKQVRHARQGTKFLLLTNDKPVNFHAENADKILEQINNVDISSASRSVNQVISFSKNEMENEALHGADLYYYSDFQQSSFAAMPASEQLKNINFYALPVQPEEVEDVSLDTAFLTSPALQTGKNNLLVVHTHLTGKTPKDQPVLQLTVNGQVKSAASVNFNGKTESFDTLSFQVNSNGWQHIEVTLNDIAVHYNDTFRLAACNNRNYAVLELNEGTLNPYIQASFRSYDGFRLNQQEIVNAPKDWKNFNLVILNNITRIDHELGKRINDALQAGQSICIFPAKTQNFAAINEGLKDAGDITIMGLDTAAQTTGNLQQGSSLVKDIFDKIPENVQLPVANWHYSITSGLSANQQSIISFRNGDPYIASFTPSSGKLYICSGAADLQSGNFVGSYFFTPFLYEMAMLSSVGSIYAVSAGSRQPVYVPLQNVSIRNTAHVFGKGLDIIPPQRPNGAGLDVYLDEVIRQPGFYQLTVAENDTLDVALNPDIHELHPDYTDIASLKKNWKGDNIHWISISDSAKIKDYSTDEWPLWKIAVILGLLMLAGETFLLAKKQKVEITNMAW